MWSTLLRGGGTLAVATVLERGLSFGAHLLAARLAGRTAFGAYSLALSTAGMVASYAGFDLSATATRFSGDCPRQSPAYPRFLRNLALVVLATGGLGSLVLIGLAGPFARIYLGQPSMIWMLRVAGLTVFGRLALDSCRGVALGQRAYRALLLVGLASGGGLIVLLPIAARFFGPDMMVGARALSTLCAVFFCIVFARRVGILSAAGPDAGEFEPAPSVGDMFGYGSTRLLAVLGIGLAGWYLAAELGRSDPSMSEVSLYAVAQQWRNLAAMGPGILVNVAFPLMTGRSGRDFGGVRKVLRLDTFLVAALTVLVAGSIMLVLPWLLRYLYGSEYLASELPALLVLGSVSIHIGASPVANRLSMVSLRAFGFVNAIWAALVFLLGWILIPSLGAVGATLAWSLAHLVAGALSCAALAHLDEEMPGDLPRFLGLAVGASGLLVGLGYWRMEGSVVAATAAMGTVQAMALGAFWIEGRRRRWFREAE